MNPEIILTVYLTSAALCFLFLLAMALDAQKSAEYAISTATIGGALAPVTVLIVMYYILFERKFK